MKIAVIGLGIAGLAIATRLAQAGHDVDGFEQFDLMHARGSSHGDTRIIRMTPGEGEAYVRLAARAAPIWRDWENENGAPLIHWTGGIMAGPPGSPFVRACRELSARYGHPASTPTPSDMRRETRNALAFPQDWEICRQSDCGVVYADDVRRFLIAKAGGVGARLNANTPMRRQDAARAFDAVIIAAGPWSARLFPNLLRVERRVLGWFKTALDLPVICVDDEVGVYGMPTRDGFYKVGLHAAGPVVDPDKVEEPNTADAVLLARHAGAYLRLDDAAPVRMARCLYTLTPDSNFLLSPLADNVLAFSCCSGHGFKYAPAYGEIALDWIEGRRDTSELKAFASDRAAARATPLGGAPSR